MTKECPVERSLRLINLSNDKLVRSIITSNLLQAGVEPAYLIRMIESSEQGVQCFQKIKEYEHLSGIQLLKPHTRANTSPKMFQLSIKIQDGIFSKTEDLWGESLSPYLIITSGPQRHESETKSGLKVNFDFPLQL